MSTNQTHTQASAQPSHDHMGRRTTNSVGETFRQDLPWIIALFGVICFVIAGLSGVLR